MTPPQLHPVRQPHNLPTLRFTVEAIQPRSASLTLDLERFPTQLATALPEHAPSLSIVAWGSPLRGEKRCDWLVLGMRHQRNGPVITQVTTPWTCPSQTTACHPSRLTVDAWRASLVDLLLPQSETNTAYIPAEGWTTS